MGKSNRRRTPLLPCNPRESRGCDLNKINRNVKVNYENLQLYQVGRDASGIKKLTLRDCKYKEEMYIDTFFGDVADDDHGNMLGVSGVINTFHGTTQLEVEKPFTESMFNGASSHWRHGQYYIPKCDPPTKNTYSWKKYRQQVRDMVQKTPNSNGRAGLLEWLSSKSQWFPINVMARVHEGILESLTGYYIKCNCCHALSYLPYLTELPETCSKKQIIHLLEVVQNKTMNDFGMLDLDFEVYGESAMMLGFLFDNCKFVCYNCNTEVFEMTFVPLNVAWDLTIEHNTINVGAIELEMLKKCLYTDVPPPEELRKAFTAKSEMENTRIRNILIRSNQLFLNCYGNADSKQIASDSQSGCVFQHTQRITEERMCDLDVEEILLTAELSSLVGGSLFCTPSNLTVFHSLHDVAYVDALSTWMREMALPVKPTDYNGPGLRLYSGAQSNLDLAEVIRNQRLIITVNANDQLSMRQDVKISNKNIYTRCSNSDHMVRWDSNLASMVSRYHKVVVDDEEYSINIVKHTTHMMIVQFKKINQTLEFANVMMGAEKIQVKLPTIDPNSVLSSLGIFGNSWKYYTLDCKLVHRLLINAISGNKTTDAIMTYLSGLSATRYVVGNNRVDLTNIEIQDGMPEIIYCLIVLSDNRKMLSWSRLLCDTNFDPNAASQNLYKFLISKALNLAKNMNLSLFDKINSIINDRTKLFFQRDNMVLRHVATGDLDSIKPFKIIFGTYQLGINNNMRPNTDQCEHHKNCCMVHVGKFECNCCGIATAEEDGNCLCCKTTNTCYHKCSHKCVKPHKCSNCKIGIYCGLTTRCLCCGINHCQKNCPNCPLLDITKSTPYRDFSTKPTDASRMSGKYTNEREQPARKHDQWRKQRQAGVNITKDDEKSQKSQSKPHVSKRETEEKDITLTSVDGVKYVKKEYVKPKSAIKKFHMESEVVMMTSIRRLTSPASIIITSSNDERVFVPYMAKQGVITARREPMDSNDVVNWTFTPSYCFYLAIELQGGPTVDAQCELYADIESMKLDDISDYAENLGLNIIVNVFRDVSYIMRFGNIDDAYFVITHETAVRVDNPNAHWLVTRAPIIKEWPRGLLDNFDYGDIDNDEYDQIVTHDLSVDEYSKMRTKLVTEMDVKRGRIKQLSNDSIRLIEVNDSVKLFNNNNHELVAGAVSIDVPEEFGELAEQCFNHDVLTSQVASQISEIGKVTEENADDEYKNFVKHCFLTCQEVRTKIINGGVSPKLTIEITSTDPLVIIPNDVKIKALDIVRVTNDDEEPRFMTVIKTGRNCCVYDGRIGRKEVSIFPMSYGSTIRQLCAALNGCKNLDNWKNSKVTSCVSGYAGTGKSTVIKKLADKHNWTVTSKLRVAINSYKEDGFKVNTTMEQLLLNGLTTTKVVVDEASTINIFDMIMLCNKPNLEFKFYGDDSQIGMIDTTSIVGMRYRNSVYDYYETEYWHQTHRFGNPLCGDIISKLCPLIIPAKHTTEYREVKIDEIKDVIKYCESENVDVVYTFYEMHRNAIQKSLKQSSKLKVLKVHADQGTQANNVAILYHGNADSPNSILNNSKYINTALTRQLKNLHWITSSRTNYPLVDVVRNLTIGADSVIVADNCIDIDSLTLLRDLTEPEIAVIRSIINSTFLKFKIEATVTIEPHQILITNISVPGMSSITIGKHGMIIDAQWLAKKMFERNIGKFKQILRENISKYEMLDAELVEQESIELRKVRAQMTTAILNVDENYFDIDDLDKVVLKDKEIVGLESDEYKSEKSSSNASNGSSFFGKLTEMFGIFDSSSTNTSVATSSVGSHQGKTLDISNIAKDTEFSVNFSPEQGIKKNTKITTVRMSTRMWASVIQIADVYLNSSVGGVRLPLMYANKKIFVSAFNGCSLQAGLIFKLGKNRQVLISSAHASVNEGLLSMLASPVRQFVGEKDDVEMIKKLLDEDAFLLNIDQNITYVIGRIIERVTNLQAACCEGGFGKNKAGSRWKEENEKKLVELGVPQNAIVWIPGHQRVEYVVYPSNGKLLVAPGNREIKTMNDVFKHTRGIQGVENTTLSLSNKFLADAVLERKIRAAQSEAILVHLPLACKQTNMNFVDNYLNEDNINIIEGACMDDTVCSILNAVCINFIHKVLRLKDLDLSGINAQIVSLQNVEQYKLHINEISMIERHILKDIIGKKVNGIRKQIEETVDQESKNKLVERRQTLIEQGAFVRSTKSSESLLIGYGTENDDYKKYKYVFFISRDGTTDSEFDTNDGRMVIGNNSRMIINSKLEGRIVLRMGPYSLRIRTPTYKGMLCIQPSHVSCKVKAFKMGIGNSEIIRVPEKLYKKMLSRALVGDTSVEDLLAYTRSQASTMIYTATGPKEVVQISVVDIFKYCVVVDNIVRKNKKFMSSASSLLSAGKSMNSLPDELWNTIKSVFSQWLLSNTKLMDWFEIVSNLLDMGIKNTSETVYNTLLDVDVSEVQQTYKLVFVDKRTSRSATTQTTNPDDDTKSDDKNNFGWDLSKQSKLKGEIKKLIDEKIAKMSSSLNSTEQDDAENNDEVESVHVEASKTKDEGNVMRNLLPNPAKFRKERETETKKSEVEVEKTKDFSILEKIEHVDELSTKEDQQEKLQNDDDEFKGEKNELFDKDVDEIAWLEDVPSKEHEDLPILEEKPRTEAFQKVYDEVFRPRIKQKTINAKRKYMNIDEIPIYSYWDSENVPEIVKKCMLTLEKSGFRFTKLNDKNVKEILGEELPIEFHSWIPQYKSDWIRYKVLSVKGGWWCDASVALLMNLQKITQFALSEKVDGVVFKLYDANVPLYENSVMFCNPANTLWCELIANQIESTLKMCEKPIDQFEMYGNLYGFTSDDIFGQTPGCQRDYLRNFAAAGVLMKFLGCKLFAFDYSCIFPHKLSEIVGNDETAVLHSSESMDKMLKHQIICVKMIKWIRDEGEKILNDRKFSNDSLLHKLVSDQLPVSIEELIHRQEIWEYEQLEMSGDSSDLMVLFVITNDKKSIDRITELGLEKLSKVNSVRKLKKQINLDHGIFKWKDKILDKKHQTKYDDVKVKCDQSEIKSEHECDVITSETMKQISKEFDVTETISKEFRMLKYGTVQSSMDEQLPQEILNIHKRYLTETSDKKKDVRDDAGEVRSKPKTLMVYAGSRGDCTPMNAILENIYLHHDVTILGPKEGPRIRKNVEYIYYMDSYDSITTRGAEGKPLQLSKVLAGLLNAWKDLSGRSQFDYVVNLFFSLEGIIAWGKIKTLVIIPQVDRTWEITRFERNDILTKLFKKIVEMKTWSKTTVEYVWAVPIGLKNDDDNMGFPISLDDFSIDDDTHLVHRWAMEKQKKIHVVTLGSMKPSGVGKRLTTMLHNAERPTVVVTAWASTTKEQINVEGINIPLSISKYSQNDVLIVKSMNYRLLSNCIESITHHGGAGTALTAWMLGIKQKIKPVAFDQYRNLEMMEWLEQQQRLEIADELHEFRTRVLKKFDIKTQEVPRLQVDFLTLSSVHMNIPKVKPNNEVCIMCRCVKKMCSIVNKYQGDCVPRSMIESSIELQLPKVQVEYIKDQLEKLKPLKQLFGLGDVVHLIILMQLSAEVVYNDMLYIIVNSEKPDLFFRIMIENDLKHCSVLTNYEIDHEKEARLEREQRGKFNSKAIISDYWIDSNEAERHKWVQAILLCVSNDDVKIQETQGLDRDVVKFLMTAKDIKLTNSLKTEMRKKESLKNVVLYPMDYGYTGNNEPRVHNFDVLRCYTEVGILIGIVLYNFFNKTQFIILCPCEEKLTNCHWIEKIGRVNIDHLIDPRPSKPLLFSDGDTAINQTTKEMCAQIGKRVLSVGQLNAQHLIIYNTWNRKHHIEKERECITTAKTMSIIPTDITAYEKKELITKRFPRAVVLAGKFTYIIELTNNEVNRQTTTEALNQILEFKFMMEGVFEVLTPGPVITFAERFLLPIETDTEIVYEYANINNKGKLTGVLKIDEILEHYRIDMTPGLKSKIKKWAYKMQLEEENIRLTHTEGRVNSAMVKRLFMEHIRLTNGWLWVSDNLHGYKVIVEGSGSGNQERFKQELTWNQMSDKSKDARSGKFGEINVNKINKLDFQAQHKERETMRAALQAKSLLDSINVSDSKVISLIPSSTIYNTSGKIPLIDVYALENGETYLDSISVDELSDAKTMDYWENTNQLIDINVHMPKTKGFKIHSRIQPMSIGKSTKLIMEVYPAYARPSLTKMYAEEFNSVSTRYGRYEEIRTIIIDPIKEYVMFKDNYYRQDVEHMLDMYKSNPITIDHLKIKDWISDHNYPKFVGECLDNHFSDGWESHRINDVEVHSKTEQTTKLTKLSRWFDEVVSRSIVAGSYAISAMFGSFFNEGKKRMKDCLRPDVIYADGLTPEQLAARLVQFNNVTGFVEDDLTQQDRQTVEEMIKTERLVYLDLGMDESTVDFYLKCHNKWKWKGHGSNGVWNAMRLTGQATTAFGNAIVNLIVHNRFVIRNRNKIKAIFVLGDDNIMLTTAPLNVSGHGTIVAKYYNMVSKISYNESVGGFLSMLVHNIEGEVRLCPHFKRLRHRYSVSNYTYTAEEMAEKIDSRTLSYCFMLGNINQSKTIASSIASVDIPDWYNVRSSILANAVYDQSSPELIEDHIGKLLYMMEHRSEVIRKEFIHWSEMAPYKEKKLS